MITGFTVCSRPPTTQAYAKQPLASGHDAPLAVTLASAAKVFTFGGFKRSFSLSRGAFLGSPRPWFRLTKWSRY